MTDNQRGIAAILLSAVAFVSNDALMKLIATDLPAGETLFLRGVGASAILLVWCVVVRERAARRLLGHPVFIARTLAAATSAVLIILSLQRLPLATVSGVIQVTPLAVMAGAALLFRERISAQRWLAALAGFTGVMLIIQPFKAGLTATVLLPLAALAATVIRDLCTRGIPAGTSALLISTVSTVAAMLGGGLLGLMEQWVWPDGRTWLLIGCCSVLVSVAYTAGVIAMRTGELSAVVPFRYAQIPLTLLLGYSIWGDLPDALAATGLLIVGAAGLYALGAERPRRR